MAEVGTGARFEVLGPMRILVGDTEVTVPAGRIRTLLAVLLLNANAAVPVPTLIDAIWGSQPPSNARNQVQGCVSRIRSRLARAGAGTRVIATDSAGYRLHVPPSDLDLLEFRARRGEARNATANGRTGEAAACYRAALALWRGPALPDVKSEPVVQAATALNEERLQAMEECVALELALGKASELVGDLVELARQHPYREAIHGFLMLALYRAGRQADSLAVYRRVRQLIHDELGTEPGTGLQGLHQAILNRDPELDAPQPTPAAAAAASAPRELPADVAGFAGRSDALATLDEIMRGRSVPPRGPVVISAINGMAGVGKTALAVRWGHRVSDRFPDGQLYINLRGYANATPLRPIEALSALLRSLGTPPERIPTDEAQASALYRTLLADRRILIVLDNARSPAQVRPLLPGSPGCIALVTSRDRLSGLVARDGARRLPLDVLPADEAHALLTDLLGGKRVDAERAAVHDLAQACAYLPLALRIAAANLADQPASSVAAYVTQLTSGDRLMALQAGGDEESSVLATLDLSYRTLPSETARLYGRLGLHPGLDIEPYAAAALTETTMERAEQLLDRLVSAYLLQTPTPGRYAFHDLVRLHATHTASSTETEPARTAAVGRLLDYYRHTASMAMDAAHPYERERRPIVRPTGYPTPRIPDRLSAIAWLDAALSNLLAVAAYSARHGWPEHAIHLSAILHRHLRTRGRYLDAQVLHDQALAAARVTGQPADELGPLVGLGEIHQLQGRYEQAIDHLERAVDVARATGNHAGELYALLGLADIYLPSSAYEQASDHFGRALGIARAIGSRAGELDALIGLADIHRLQGRHEQAADHYRQALGLARAAYHRTGELSALLGLADVDILLGRTDRATEHFAQALEIARAAGHRVGELNALRGRGRARRLQGNYEPAIDDFRQALEIAQDTGYRNGELSALVGLAWAQRLLGQHEEAGGNYQRALDLAREIGNRNWEFEALYGLARTRHATRDSQTALATFRHALDLAANLQQLTDQVRAHDGLGHCYNALHQPELARRHWLDGLAILSGLGADHTGDDQVSAQTIRSCLADVEQRS